MAENTQNITATTNEGEGKEKASGVKVPTVESKDLPEAPKETQENSKEVQDVTSIAEAVTGEDVQEIVSALLKRPEHIQDSCLQKPLKLTTANASKC